MRVKIERGEWKWFPLYWLPDSGEAYPGQYPEIEMTEAEHRQFAEVEKAFEEAQHMISERAWLVYEERDRKQRDEFQRQTTGVSDVLRGSK